MKPCVFLDRDGVLNLERGEYTFREEDFRILDGVRESLKILKEHGFLLIVITNQGGIARGLYTRNDVQKCHRYLQEQTGHLIDDMFYSPYHPDFTQSISRKPDTLMFERALARYHIDIQKSWMVGDSDRDIEAAEKLGIRGIRVNKPWENDTKYLGSLREAVEVILGNRA